MCGRLLPDPQVLLQSWWHCGMSSTEELPQAGDIEVEYDDLYRQDEEQAYVTLMSQEVASLNFAAEANYTCLLYTSPSPRDQRGSRMPSSA